MTIQYVVNLILQIIIQLKKVLLDLMTQQITSFYKHSQGSDKEFYRLKVAKVTSCHTDVMIHNTSRPMHVCVFQCQPTALLHALSSTQGR